MAKGTGQNFGALGRDADRNPITTASAFVTADATGTPQTSPLSITTTATFTLVVPDSAVCVTLFLDAAATVKLKVTNDSTMTTYDLLLGSTKEIIQCSRMQNIYVANVASATNTLYFKFYTV